MNTDHYLNKLHNEILEILDEIVKICERHDLKYYLIGGTLLGAIRHKGFIPWDDDLDIVMPREDYIRFTEQYYYELAPEYKLDWYNTNPDYNHIYCKVYKMNTLFEEEINDRVHSKTGIFVDIFPMDTSKGYSSEVRIRKKIVNQVNLLLFLKGAKQKKGIISVLLPLVSTYRLQRIAQYFMTLNSKKGGDFYSNFGSQYNIKRQTHAKVDFGNGLKLPFEDRFYNCPVNYDKILTSIFGADYLELPPENKRRSHYPYRVRFSDGEEIFFGSTANKLMVGKE